MAFQLRIEELIEYTDWERGKWREFFQTHGDQVLKIGAGANGDGRFQSVGDLVAHISRQRRGTSIGCSTASQPTHRRWLTTG